MITRLLVIGLFAGAILRAQCGLCTVNNTLPPRTFDPPFLTIQVGQDTEVVVQFALPETVMQAGAALYPNYAIFVDSLYMMGGNTYVSLKGQPTVAPAYNSGNPANGALRFHEGHRYKQVKDSPPTHANVIVYQNPGGSSPSNPTPPRGCVRACIRGIAPTPTADTLRILIRGFIDPNSISATWVPTPSITGNDINNKDTSNLMPTLTTPLGNVELWADSWTEYAVRVVNPAATVQVSAISDLFIAPNPTQGAAEIRYTLSRPAHASLRIFSVTGAEILQQSFGVRPAGESSYTAILPAGAYIVELKAGDSVLRQRLIVLR
ncbi:MAG: T9SS type A sorting domain-containing protein [Bacteroidia bacterium]|nr:T9SS type A sorting domain-containing protein [Bacteroidia bacterium]